MPYLWSLPGWTHRKHYVAYLRVCQVAPDFVLTPIVDNIGILSQVNRRRKARAPRRFISILANKFYQEIASTVLGDVSNFPDDFTLTVGSPAHKATSSCNPSPSRTRPRRSCPCAPLSSTISENTPMALLKFSTRPSFTSSSRLGTTSLLLSSLPPLNIYCCRDGFGVQRSKLQINNGRHERDLRYCHRGTLRINKNRTILSSWLRTNITERRYITSSSSNLCCLEV